MSAVETWLPPFLLLAGLGLLIWFQFRGELEYQRGYKAGWGDGWNDARAAFAPEEEEHA